MNTRFSYMYRDSANWKDFYDCVVAGEFTDAQKEAIQNACDGTYFIPGVLGLPGGVRVGDPGYDVRYDHPWCEFDADCDLTLTEDAPTVSYTAESLTQAFIECQDKWESLPVKESVLLPPVSKTKPPEGKENPSPESVSAHLNKAHAEVLYDLHDPEYGQAKTLLASLCEHQFPELHAAVFQHEDLDLIFKNPDGSFQLVYYNPDASAGGQIVQCPFDVSQAKRMQYNDTYLDVLAENTQYLSDINTEHFFRTAFDLLSAKAEGRFLGTDVKAVCRNICTQTKEASYGKDSLHAKLASAASRAGAQDHTDTDPARKAQEREDDPYEK